tara:strand:+ start:13871 stop:14644 length:774 start_codon:yes stop_codon:yes gene_type:complete
MKIALIQMTSGLEPKDNLAKLDAWLSQAHSEGAKVAFLPEVFYSMSNGLAPSPYLPDGGNEHDEAIKNLAIKNKIAIVGGSAAAKLNGSVINRAYNFDAHGNDLGHYDKRKLFACDLSNTKLTEADIYTSGNEARLVEVEDWKIGLGICFDLRYPEFARAYNKAGAEILTFASAFTVPTGRAHWHTLLKARAIENQCYVIASGQWGEHNERIRTFGHSLVIDPWGEVVVDAGEGEKLVFAELSHKRVADVRAMIKMT